MTIPSRLKTHFAVVALSWAAMGCSYADGPVQRPRPLSAPRATAPAVNSAGLPSGWSWPFNPKSGAAVFSQLATIRPVDLSRLIPNVGRGPCAPTQVAPFVWVAPNCSAAMTKPLAASPHVVHRSSFQEQSGLPPAVDLREQGLDGPVKYQQMVGVCWAFAISTVMDNAVRRAGRQDVLSPLHVVAANPWNDIWSKGRSDRSLTLEPVWSYDPVKACKLNEAKSEVWCGEAYHVEPGSWRSDPALVAEREHANRSGEYTITHIESFDVKPGNPSQIAAAVATGRAVFASFNINTPVWGERGSAGPDIPNYQATDGAHAVAIVGYKTTPGGLRFLLHNSWGVEWRDHGYADLGSDGAPALAGRLHAGGERATGKRACSSEPKSGTATEAHAKSSGVGLSHGSGAGPGVRLVRSGVPQRRSPGRDGVRSQRQPAGAHSRGAPRWADARLDHRLVHRHLPQRIAVRGGALLAVVLEPAAPHVLLTVKVRARSQLRDV